MKPQLFWPALCLAATLAHGVSAQDVRYRVIPILDPPGPSWEPPWTWGRAINDAGQVAVEYLDGNGYAQAALWDPVDGLTLLGDLGSGRGSTPQAINNLGHIAGTSGTVPTEAQAFLWTPETGMIGLGDLPGGQFYSWARGVNDLDQVVGNSFSDRSAEEAFLWDPVAGMLGLGFLPGGRNSVAYAINSHVQVVGRAGSSPFIGGAFLWEPEIGMSTLGDLPAGRYIASAYDINELGQIVGSVATTTGESSFLWDPEKGFTLIPPNPAHPHGGTRVSAVNDLGQVVGASNQPSNYPPFITFRWFVWDAEHGTRDLQSLIEARTPPEVRVEGAIAINNRGQIVSGDEGTLQAVVLTPVVLGDMNCDGAVDAFDIEGFVTGLIDPAAYAARWPDCFADSAGDVNQDAAFDAFDIEPFIELLSGP